MFKLLTAMSAAALLVSVGLKPGWAVEPEAPEHIISKQEAFSIAVRWQLDELPATSDPGEVKDRAAARRFYSHHAGAPLWVTLKNL